MKKTLLISAFALLGLVSAKAAEQPTVYHGVTLTGQALTPSTTLVDGGQYLIYDGDTDRHAMRYANADGTDVIGNTNVTPTSSATLTPFYVWTAEAVDDNGTTKWRFKNEALQKYIGMLGVSGNNGTNSGLNDEGWLCEVVAHPSNGDAFMVYGLNGSTTIMWDGMGGGKMVGWNAGNGHPYFFYSLTQENLTVDDYYKVVYVAGETRTSHIVKSGSAMPSIGNGFVASSEFPATVTENGEHQLLSVDLRDGWRYNIKNFNNGLYLNLDTTGVPDSGNNACVSETATEVVLSQDPANANKWSLKNAATNLYLDANTWNSIRNSETPMYWIFEPVDYVGEPVQENIRYRIKNEKTGNQGYLGCQANLTGNKRHALWSNCSTSNEVLWTLTNTMGELGDVTFTLKANDNSVVYSYTVNEIELNREHSYEGFPFYVKQPVVFTPTQDGATVELELAEGCNLFKFFNARYRRWTVTNETGLTTVAGQFADGEWYIEAPEGDYFKIYSPSNNTYFGEIPNSANPTPKVAAENAQPYLMVVHSNGAEKFYNATGSKTNISMNIQGNKVAGWSDSDMGSWWFMVYNNEIFTANQSLFYGNVTGEPDKTHKSPFYSKLEEAQTIHERIAGLSEKSIPNIEELRSNLEAAIVKATGVRFGRDILAPIYEELTAAVAAVPEVSDDQATWSQVKLKGDILIDNGLVAGQSYIDTWNSVVASVELPVTEEDITNLTNAYNALCGHVGGVSVNIRPYVAQYSHMYVCGDNETQPIRSTAEVSRAWTFVRNDADNGFHIYNEYTNRYMKHGNPGDDHPAMSYVTDKANASSYKLDVYKPEEMAFAIITIDSGIAADRTYLHSNTVDQVQCWERGDGSSFYISVIDDLTAAREYFNGVNDFAGEYSAAFVGKTEGNNYGQYTYTGEGNIADLQEAYVTAAGLNADDAANPDDLRAATDAYRSAWLANQNRTCSLNAPAAGDLIRLKHADRNGNNAKYASNVNKSNGRMDMVNAGNLSNTVWYLDEGNRLVSFSTGLILGDFSSANKDNNRWATVLSTATEAPANGATITLGNRIAERFTIQASNGRYIHGSGAEVNCSNNSNDDGCHWIIERVEWLPIPVETDGNYATVNVPVDLDFNPHGEKAPRAVAHSGEIQGNKLKCTIHGTNGSYLPANTSAVLKVNEKTNDHVYARVIYPVAAETPETQGLLYDTEEETQQPAETVNHLKSNVLATAKEEGVNYYVLNPSAGAFVSHEGDYVPGFATHLAVTENPQSSYALDGTVSIDEITVDGGVKATGIYDLQGRKLAAPAKGINIINGKKVLVK